MIPTAVQSRAAIIRAIRQAVYPPSRPLPPTLRPLFGRDYRTPLPVLQAVISAVADKLFVARITHPQPELAGVVGKVLSASEYHLRLLFAGVVRDGVGYLMVVTDPKPALAYLPAYDGSVGAFRTSDGSGGVVSVDETNRRVLTLYRPGSVEQYAEEQTQWVKVASERWTYPIPIVEFGDGHSFVEPLIQLQDDLNLAVLDLLAANRSVGFPLRYILGSSSSEYLTNLFGQPLIDATGSPIRRTITLEPGSFIRISEPTASIGQLPATAPDAVVINVLLELFSLLTGVPLFFFKGTVPSGASIQAAEQRLNATVERYQALLSDPLRSVCDGIAAMMGLGVGNGDWGVEWYPPQIETEELRIQRVQWVVAAVNAGLMSKREAVRALHPDWPEDRLQVELGEIDGTERTNGNKERTTN